MLEKGIPMSLHCHEIRQSVKMALAEDLNHLSPQEGDITAQLVPESQKAKATLISREQGIFCGQAWADETFQQVDPTIEVIWHVKDGDSIEQDQTLCSLSGSARSILTAERTALNFIQTLSGTASVTQTYVNALQHSSTKLLDTRKTIPTMRQAQKYAVTCGGGYNHRIGLFDAFLIKENHILACGGIAQAVHNAKKLHPEKPIEIEVANLDELQQAIDSKADIAMLDNFSLPMLAQAVQINQKQIKLEISGNVTLDTISVFGELGVDYISVGALTKHIQALDLSLRIIHI